MDDINDSFEMAAHEDSFHIAPIKVNEIKKPNNKVFASMNSNNHPFPSNKCLKVITTNKMNGKLSVCD